MTIKERLQKSIEVAMRAKEKDTVTTLRMVMAAFKQVEVDERIVVDDIRALQILDKLVKQRHESIHQFQLANRQDLVNKEQFELDLIKEYLPEPLSADEVMKMIQETIHSLGATSPADMGKVMTQLKPMLQGRVDMHAVSQQVQTQLKL